MTLVGKSGTSSSSAEKSRPRGTLVLFPRRRKKKKEINAVLGKWPSWLFSLFFRARKPDLLWVSRISEEMLGEKGWGKVALDKCSTDLGRGKERKE